MHPLLMEAVVREVDAERIRRVGPRPSDTHRWRRRAGRVLVALGHRLDGTG